MAKSQTISAPVTSFSNLDDMLYSGIIPGSFTAMMARQTGKSSVMRALHRQYMRMYNEISVAQAYKGEWKIQTTYSTDENIKQWLLDTFGEPGRAHQYRWRANNVKFGVYFLRHESDIMLFRLRWM